MQFKDIIGQQQLKSQLINMVNQGRISHAQLFLGNLGHGGLAMSIAYAQYIFCENKTENDSCGSCPACLKINKIAHPDLHFSFPFNKNKTHKSPNTVSDNFAAEWREMILEDTYFEINDWQNKIEIENKQAIINVKESQSIIKKLSLKPYESDYKILIMWLADKMNDGAANKLLKLIEEPTDKTIIILLAEQEENLLQTIRSRTQLVRVPPIAPEVLKEELIQNGCKQEQATKFSKTAEGNLVAARNLMEQEGEELMFFEMFKKWMRACYKADVQEMHKWVEDATSKKMGREEQKRFLTYALEVMREGILLGYTGNQLQRFYGDEATFMKKFAPFVHTENIMGLMELLNEAHFHISRNAFAKIIFMDMSMKFANLLRLKKRTFVNEGN